MTRVSDGRELADDAPLMIDTVTAYVAFDTKDNAEGIIAFLKGETWMPMIGADREMLESMRPIAEQTARSMGVKVSLVRFGAREVIVDDITAPTVEP